MDLAEAQALADEALEHLGEGHVTVRFHGALTVVLVAVVDGRAARIETDGDIARAARAARLRAAQPRAWPAPELPAPHAGEPRILGSEVVEAHANSRGLSAAQAYDLTLPDADDATRGDPDVAGPQAVAAALSALRAAYGVGLVLGGPPPRLPDALSLSDDSTVGLARAYDAEGVPRQRVALVERGRFAGGVHDSSSQRPSTGHATRALTLAPRADNLVMAPGTADLGAPGRAAVNLDHVIEVGRERTLVALRGGGCALVPAVRVRNP